MDIISKLIKMLDNGLDKPSEYILFVTTLVIGLSPMIIKTIKIVSLNEFDRLLTPKNESSLQQKVVKIFDYFLFLLLYISLCTFLSFIINTEISRSSIGLIIVVIFLNLFILTLIPIIFKNTISLLAGKKAKLSNWINKIFRHKILKINFIINIYLSFIIYTVILHYFYYNIEQYKDNILGVLLYPMVLLTIYRSYTRKYNFKYICQIISEKEFNESMLILYYALDKERVIFYKPNIDDDYKEIFMYDRAANKHFKFTRANIFN